MPDGGWFLGWDLLAFEYGGVSPHSWLCNGLEVEFHNRLGIRPNEHGFLDDWAKATEAAKICGVEELGEPLGWWAWAVVQYPTRRSTDESHFAEEETRVPLSDRDRDRFLEGLYNPSEPNEALKRAFLRHPRSGG